MASGSMFSVSLSDRLKAAVNTLDAAGTALQARAIGQPSRDGPSRPLALSVPPSSFPTISTSPTFANNLDSAQPDSPTRTMSGDYVASTSALAENALSGLRKSFSFGGRPSLDGHRPSASVMQPAGLQELKDIPSTPTATTAQASGSRPTSPAPARFLNPSNFELGSDPSSMTATPQQRRSPAPTHVNLVSRSPRSPAPRAVPTPDPSDPATFPLPPSPSLSPSPLLSASFATYSDPLGASPLLDSHENADPPALGLQSPTPVAEITLEAVGLVVQGVDVEASPEPPVKEEEEANGSEEVSSPVENGRPPEIDGQAEQKLAAAERRYEDLSQRFTVLLKQKHDANKVLKELTPLEGGIQDHEALEGWVRMMNGKVDMITDEMKRLQDKINLQDSRMGELRDTHRMEGTSQGDLISKLCSQLATVEGNLVSQAADLLAAEQLRADLTKAQTQAKEEEEKRTKAISLLKTVRMKLVKAEKDRAEERAERSRAGEETERVKAEREREVNALRKGFEREVAGAKERFEKDLGARKAAWELEMITTKATHAKEMSGRITKVNGLEAIVKELNLHKADQFEVLQSRQAEVETSRAEMEVMRNRTKELEYQLREATDRCAMLEDSASSSRPKDRGRTSLGFGLTDGGRGTPSPSPARTSSYSNNTSAAEVQRLLAEAEARFETKLSDLRYKIRSLEKERNEAEEEWATKLQERVREQERLRRTIAEKESEYTESLRSRREKESLIEGQEEARLGVEKDMKALRAQLEAAKGDVSVAAEAERAARDELSSLHVQISTLQIQLEDSKSHTKQLRSSNKTLRDELRKVQSSVQLMERQRNPGVGYWSTTSPGAGPSRSGITTPMTMTEPATPTREIRRSLESAAESLSMRTGTGRSSPASSVKDKEEEEVNLEYLRNVILQFLEHKEMRPNLVRVLSVILHFTPQELRRLNAKLTA